MIKLKFVTKDSEIPEKEIDHLSNKYQGDFVKVTTVDGWNYSINFDNNLDGDNFIIQLNEKYPHLEIEKSVIDEKSGL